MVQNRGEGAKPSEHSPNITSTEKLPHGTQILCPEPKRNNSNKRNPNQKHCHSDPQNFRSNSQKDRMIITKPNHTNPPACSQGCGPNPVRRRRREDRNPAQGNSKTQMSTGRKGPAAAPMEKAKRRRRSSTAPHQHRPLPSAGITLTKSTLLKQLSSPVWLCTPCRGTRIRGNARAMGILEQWGTWSHAATSPAAPAAGCSFPCAGWQGKKAQR